MAKKPSLTAEGANAYYEAMTRAKVAAGLSFADATEVTARQRAEDEANGVTISAPELEPAEQTPAE